MPSELEQLIADLNKPGIHTSATGAQLAKALQGLWEELQRQKLEAAKRHDAGDTLRIIGPGLLPQNPPALPAPVFSPQEVTCATDSLFRGTTVCGTATVGQEPANEPATAIR